MSQLTTDERKAFSMALNEQFPWLLLGISILSAVILILTKTRRVIAWLFPLSLAGVGTMMILVQRREHAIEEKEALILEQLETLDPVARAQVLIRVTEKELSQKSNN
jgi:hypothetical protein